MRSATKTNYRNYQRVLVSADTDLSCEGLGISLDGRVVVIGLGGMYIRTRDSHPVGTAFGIRLRSDGDVVEAICVVRQREPGGLGVEFVELRGRNEASLKKVLARLKD